MINRFIPAKITQISPLTDSSKEIELTTIDPQPFVPGQFVNLKVYINNEAFIRSYSICSTPNEGLKIGVKAIKNGKVSNFLNKQLKPNDVIEIEAPQGNFTTEKVTQKNLILIAGGSGITPLLSIAKNELAKGEKSVFLIYANSNSNEVMFRKELDLLASNFPSNFKKTEAASDGSAQYGRLNQQNLKEIISNFGVNPNDAAAMLCGPVGLMDAATTALLGLGFNANQILRESFVSTTDTEALKKESFSGDTEIKITLDGMGFTAKVNQGKTLLEAALDAGLDAPYSCMGGVCTSCKAKVISGEVKMDDDALGLMPEEIEQGYVLTCSCVAKSNGIEINYDV
jgi:ring-1,2-phenylacetyl-CoA epoxidase subunit PaaE